MTARHQIMGDGLEWAVQRIEATKDAEARLCLVDELSQAVQAAGTPVALDDNRAAFVYRGKADRVRILGDMTHWSSERSLRRIADTDLFVTIEAFPSNARLEYLLLVDGQSVEGQSVEGQSEDGQSEDGQSVDGQSRTDGQSGTDPWCRHRVLNGLGANSEFAMPNYVHHSAFDAKVRSGIAGDYSRVERFVIQSEALGYEKEVHVYQASDDTPMHSRTARLPTIYIHDGRDYIEYAHTPRLLDHLIRSGTIVPMNAVFISPPNRHEPDPPNRTTEYGLNADYAKFVAEELVPFVDERFPTERTPESRLTAGDSYAGLVSAYIPLLYPHVFGNGYSQSGYLSFQQDTLIRRYRDTARQPIRLYVDVGEYERTVGKDWLPDAEMDFLEANRRYQAVLAESGYDFVYREYPEGHTWGNWRAHLGDALPHFFPGVRTEHGSQALEKQQ